MNNPVHREQNNAKENDSAGDAVAVYIYRIKELAFPGETQQNPPEIKQQQKDQHIHQRAEPVIADDAAYLLTFAMGKGSHQRA